MKYSVLFPETENVHLIKDVGMIPYILKRDFGFDSEIICYKNGEYKYLDNETAGLKLRFMKKHFKKGKTKIDGVVHLIQNSKNIQVLQVFHFNFRSFLYITAYKSFNRRGLVYLKIDAVYQRLEKVLKSKGLKQWAAEQLIRKVDLLSIEQSNLYSLFCRKFNNYSDKVFYLPNGIDCRYMEKNCMKYDYSVKENIILTVGRLGTYEKATEVMLEAFRLLDNPQWKMILVGPIESGFEAFLTKFFSDNSFLKERIEFTGPIYDRVTLFDYYRKSKIFCLSSRSEGFPLVFLEAAFFGNLIVTTDIGGFDDITANGKYGCKCVIDDAEDLSQKMKCVIENKDLKSLSEEIHQYCTNKFDWTSLCREIYKRISGIYKENIDV